MTVPIPINDQIAEVGREIGMRRSVYKHFIAKGSMTPEEADKRTAAMEAALATLKWVEKHRDRLLQLAPDLAEPR